MTRELVCPVCGQPLIIASAIKDDPRFAVVDCQTPGCVMNPGGLTMHPERFQALSEDEVQAFVALAKRLKGGS